jgi:hypothetical protein
MFLLPRTADENSILKRLTTSGRLSMIAKRRRLDLERLVVAGHTVIVRPGAHPLACKSFEIRDPPSATARGIDISTASRHFDLPIATSRFPRPFNFAVASVVPAPPQRFPLGHPRSPSVFSCSILPSGTWTLSPILYSQGSFQHELYQLLDFVDFVGSSQVSHTAPVLLRTSMMGWPLPVAHSVFPFGFLCGRTYEANSHNISPMNVVQPGPDPRVWFLSAIVRSIRFSITAISAVDFGSHSPRFSNVPTSQYRVMEKELSDCMRANTRTLSQT